MTAPEQPQPQSQQSTRTWTPPSLSKPSTGPSSTFTSAGSFLPMASSSHSSSTTSAHATGQAPAPLSTRTVRKSSSGRKLRAQTSVSNLANSTSTPSTLPDPSLFPDPYPSGYNAANASVTPPVSLFSTGSSSARSSAYTSASPASALRSSVASSDSAHNARYHQHQHQHQPHLTRLSAGDSMIAGLNQFLENADSIHHFAYPGLDSPSPHQVGVASTADESVQLRDVDQLPSAVTARPPPSFGSRPGSRPTTMADGDPSLQTRWSSSSAASQGSSWGNFDPNDPSLRQSGLGIASGGGGNDGNAYGWNHRAPEEREEEYHTDDEENHEEDDMERTAAVLLAEQGHGEIVNGAGKELSELHVPMSMCFLFLFLFFWVSPAPR